MFTFQALQILIILIPGFISAKILDSLVVRRQDFKDLEIIIQALIFSLLIYTIGSIIGINSPIALDPDNYSILFPQPWSLVWLILVGVGLAILFAVILNQGWLMWLMRCLKITRKTSKISVWNDVFYTKSHRVIVDFLDGGQVFGWVEYFSDYSEKPFIYLAQPQWIKKGKFVETGLDGLLITPDQKIRFVEFLKD
jgi:hypothetical protein